MKITLDASKQRARELAECFVGADLVYVDEYVISCRLVGVERSFYTETQMRGINLPYETQGKHDQITIDTEANQPCIYACMKHGFTVEVEIELVGGSWECWDFSRDLEDIGRFLTKLKKHSIKSIKILGMDKMDGVEV